MKDSLQKFRIDGKIAIITGGAGLLGVQHSDAIAEAGGIPILWDINEEIAVKHGERIKRTFNVPSMGMNVDITDPDSVKAGLDKILSVFNHIDILINNATNDPKVEKAQADNWSRFENYNIEMWNKDISVGLTGAFLCSQTVGTYMAKSRGGVILNIASDLGVIAPDQRIYEKKNLLEHQQPAKPVTYSIIKHGIIGLTKYLATYWADKNVRANALSPGGVYTNQDDEFVSILTNHIPMKRMARNDEYKAAVVFLVSEASSYMTGANLIIDGGRTCW
jgi:NAD(P)-dependent dehydrogenase (short-subunit alcohol dehydrogenase family)